MNKVYFVIVIFIFILSTNPVLANESQENKCDTCLKIAASSSRNADIVIQSLNHLYSNEIDKEKKQILYDAISYIKSSKNTINIFGEIICKTDTNCKNKINSINDKLINENTKICTRCNGVGKIKTDSIIITCFKCKGTGLAEIKIHSRNTNTK